MEELYGISLFRQGHQVSAHSGILFTLGHLTASSLFIHIMPPVTLHCLVHLTTMEFQKDRFPAIYAIRHSLPSSPEHYGLLAMMVWATLPYVIWQLSYHFLITVRRREKIAAGRPTSFTWLRKSYGKSWIGRIVLSLPESLQEPAFMLVQYMYALGTMLPCPIWFWYRWPSALFLMAVFVWSIYNGATYYIDVFGKRFQNELEQLKKDVAKWHTSLEAGGSPPLPAKGDETPSTPQPLNMEATGIDDHARNPSFDKISLLESKLGTSSGLDSGSANDVRERSIES